MRPSDMHALRRLVSSGDSSRATADDLQGLLLQIVFALLMVFMIAYFLFVDKQKQEREEEVMDLNRQKLTLALDKTAEDYRIRYGLNALMTQGTDGKRTFAPEEHVRGGKLILTSAAKAAFSAGSSSAFTDYSDLPSLAGAWLSAAIAEAKVDIATLSDDERAWLSSEIARRTEEVRLDVRGMQRSLASLLQSRWTEHPETLGDVSDVRDLAEALKSRSLQAVSDATGAPTLP